MEKQEMHIGHPYQDLIDFFAKWTFIDVDNYLRQIEEQLINRSYTYKDGSPEHERMHCFFKDLKVLVQATYSISNQMIPHNW